MTKKFYFAILDSEINVIFSNTGLAQWPPGLSIQTIFYSMIDFSHLLDFATQLPHPSDIGLIKPSGGFAIVPALCGLGAVFGASQFFYYSDDSKRIDPWAKPENYKN